MDANQDFYGSIPSIDDLTDLVPSYETWDKHLVKDASWNGVGRVVRHADVSIPYYSGRLIIPPNGYCMLNALS